MNKKIFIADLISMLFILLFTYAGVSKLLDYNHFRIEMGKSPLLAGISGWLAWLLPIAELCIAVILAIPGKKLIGLYLSFTLMTMFTTYLITVLRFSAFVPCTCGGLLEKMSWKSHILFNSIFIIISCIALISLPVRNISDRNQVGNS